MQNLKKNASELTTALVQLKDYHGLVLHSKSKKVWVIHPFSAAPTNFFIQSELRYWWGTCARWAAAALLKQDVSGQFVGQPPQTFVPTDRQ